MDWLQEIAGYLSNWLDWPELNIPSYEITDHRELDFSEIARAALRCREMWGLGLGPIADLSMAAEGAGIICAHVHQGNTKMDGLSQWDESQKRPFILLSNDKNNFYRSRFDLAHEIGHVVLHKNIKTFDILHLKEIERQANYFASCLLLPEELISIELPRYPSLENLLSLKRRWNVSIAAIIYRAEKMLIISEDEALRLRKSYSARGWTKGEPLDNDYDLESVRLMPRAINAILDAKIKTKVSIVRDLMMPVKDVEQLCGLNDGFLAFQPKIINNPLPKLKSSQAHSNSNVLEFKKKG
jgi:Zn-dependent peptidase ImmA (M78 family)